MNTASIDRTSDIESTLVMGTSVDWRPAATSVVTRGRTDRGLVREANEDAFVVAELASTLRITESNLPWLDEPLRSAHLLAVADGMGGHAAGALASQLAVCSLFDSLADPPTNGSTADVLADAIRVADRAVVAAERSEPSRRGMGTTLTTALIEGRQLSLAHVGDSRAYLWRGGKLRCLTKDQTVAQELVDTGQVTAAEEVDEKLRHVLTGAVGGGEAGVSPWTDQRLLRKGDALLLCTDGLTNELSEDDIADELARDRAARVTCDALVEAAKRAGGRDNVTVVLARMG